MSAVTSVFWLVVTLVYYRVVSFGDGDHTTVTDLYCISIGYLVELVF